jgi:hypothetical protein
MLAVKIKTRQLDGSVVLNNSQSAVRCAEIQPYSPEHPHGFFLKRNNWTRFSPSGTIRNEKGDNTKARHFSEAAVTA